MKTMGNRITDRRNLAVLCVIFVAGVVGGCAADNSGKIKNGWGPGVTDIKALPSVLKNRLIEDSKDTQLTWRPTHAAETVLHVATFEQACFLYRSCTADGVDEGDFKHFLLFAIVGGGGTPEEWQGLTKQQVIDLLGKPDDENGMIYTGYGSVSDGMSGIIFNFDSWGRLEYVSHAN
jgi:hypothetical protein